jgi:hypothetical protein
VSGLDGGELASDATRQGLVDADRAEDGMDFALHLAAAGSPDSVAGRPNEVSVLRLSRSHTKTDVGDSAPVVVAVRLGGEEAADAHADAARDELGEASDDDKPRIVERGETSRQGERYRPERMFSRPRLRG